MVLGQRRALVMDLERVLNCAAGNVVIHLSASHVNPAQLESGLNLVISVNLRPVVTSPSSHADVEPGRVELGYVTRWAS